MQAIIIGAGASGVLHALALRAAGVRIAAVYDPDMDRARAVADACGGRAVGSLEAAASADAKIAAICGPPNVHVAQAEMMCAAGGDRIVFVEKPVAVTRSELERIRTLPRCVPILQWRSGRALRALRRAIVNGELGPAPVVACDLAWYRDDAYFRARRGWGCGAMLSIGIHAIDAISWALDRDVTSVAGLTSTRAPATLGAEPIEGETAAVAVFRFTRGAIASFRISLDGAADTTSITICGGGRTVSLIGGEADPTGGVLRWQGRDDADRIRLEALEKDTRGALGSPLLVPYLGAAVMAIRDGEVPGDSERLPSIASTFAAHAGALNVAAAQPTRTLGAGLPTSRPAQLKAVGRGSR